MSIKLEANFYMWNSREEWWFFWCGLFFILFVGVFWGDSLYRKTARTAGRLLDVRQKTTGKPFQQAPEVLLYLQVPMKQIQ